MSDEYGKTVPVNRDRVIDFFHRNPNPVDSKFHAFAERNNYNPHEAEATAYSLATKYVNFLKGGRAKKKNIKPSDVDPKQLREGTKIEAEHTPDRDVAKRIALDHLAEVKHYYSGLKPMEHTLEAAGDKQMAKKSSLLENIARDAFNDEMEKIAGDMGKLKKSKVPLTPEERAEVMKRKAVWHHGPNGEETPAVWKSVDKKGKTTYVTNTHRAYNTAPTLKGAINRYHKFIKSTA